MGADTPISERPRFNFHIYNAVTGEIYTTLFDIQYALAVEAAEEYPHGDVSRTFESSPEEVTYTNIKERP